ncbi:hypothetical protein GCM10027024_02760 [Microbacterium insulae]
MKRVRDSRGSESWFATAVNSAHPPRMTIPDLRHTAASLSVQSRAHVKTIQRMLGHTSARMTLDVIAKAKSARIEDTQQRLSGVSLHDRNLDPPTQP